MEYYETYKLGQHNQAHGKKRSTATYDVSLDQDSSDPYPDPCLQKKQLRAFFNSFVQLKPRVVNHSPCTICSKLRRPPRFFFQFAVTVTLCANHKQIIFFSSENRLYFKIDRRQNSRRVKVLQLRGPKITFSNDGR